MVLSANPMVQLLSSIPKLTHPLIANSGTSIPCPMDTSFMERCSPQIDEGHPKCFVSNSNGGQDQQRQDQQWMKEEGSVVSVKYDFHVGKCVDIIADL